MAKVIEVSYIMIVNGCLRLATAGTYSATSSGPRVGRRAMVAISD